MVGAFPAKCCAALRNQVIVYYANETTDQAVRSDNYAALLRVLRSSPNPSASSLIDILADDAKDYPAAVQREESALLAMAKRNFFDLAMFTNALALDRHYLFYRASKGTVETRLLPELLNAPTPALATAPLARPEYFHAALLAAGSLYPPDSLDVILITNSHGGGDLALTPRVFADLTATNSKDLQTELNRVGEGTGERANWATYPGTTKLEYWQVLSDVNTSRGIRFPLVFRDTCESGVASWREFLAVPKNVGLIAHTGNDSIRYGQIDFAPVFDFDDRSPDFYRHVASALENQGIHVDTKATIWIWLARDQLIYEHPAIFFLPLAIWIVWIAWSPVIAGIRRFAASRSLRH